MVYYSNGGFNWHDVYYMPIRYREFYWKEMLDAKKKEQEEYDKAARKSKSSSRVVRR